MKKRSRILNSNFDTARALWGELPQSALDGLRELIARYGLSLSLGDLQYLDGRWYVTHSGLLRIAQGRRCSGITTTLQKGVSDAVASRWVFKATVYKTPGSKGFVGYGDADPSNVPLLVRGAEMRLAETRAVNRALRKAYGIGLCSAEEIGSFPIGNRGHLPPAISGAGLFSPSPIELGLPCGQSHSAPLGSAFEFAPSRPSVPSERRGGFSLSSSPCACPNLIPSPGAKSRKPLTLLSA